MSFRIGFTADINEENVNETGYSAKKESISPRKCIAEVYFSDRNITLSYYNDRFDLHCGDTVYVDGKMEGIRGCITDINYNFKIKVSDYKRIISVADTDVKGRFFMSGSHFITFGRNALPAEKVITWFCVPSAEEDEIVSSTDESSFLLNDLSTMKISHAVSDRGRDYYARNKVRYICLDGKKGYAIVSGGHTYEVDFEYHNGEISKLTCSCFCSYNCKHEFAAMLQLKETLENISKNYSDEYKNTDYFAAIENCSFFSFAIDGKETGSFTL